MVVTLGGAVIAGALVMVLLLSQVGESVNPDALPGAPLRHTTTYGLGSGDVTVAAWVGGAAAGLIVLLGVASWVTLRRDPWFDETVDELCCALALMISQWGPALTLRLQPKTRDPVRLLPPAPWTLRDDLSVALGSYGVAVALGVLLMHSAPLRPASNDELLRLPCLASALVAWPGLSVHALVRGRVLATHRRAWREPARVHLGLALGLAGVLLVVASFEGLLGLVAGVTTGLAGLVIACTGGALGERDPDLERAFARESQGALMRAHALGIALACATSLLHVVPWRAGVMRRYSMARASMIELAPTLRRDRLQALRRESPDAPRARSAFEDRRGR